MLVIFGPLVAAGALLLWWLFASRAKVGEKLLGLFGILAIAAISLTAAHPSMRDVAVMMFVVPVGITAFGAAAILFGAWRSGWRTALALAVCAAGFGVWDAARNDGMSGDYHLDLSRRWTPSAEDHYRASLPSQPRKASPSTEPLPSEPEWPGFRGANRDGVVRGIALAPDWKAHPPKEIWRRPVGPAWSSFCVAGKRLFTQEQRGDKEAVLCLDADTGLEQWVYEYDSRFYESMGGAGPRATPTLADGQLFVLGGSGLLHCLDPLTGKVRWKRNLKDDAACKAPMWGFASSPLVAHGVVIVHAGGKENKGVLAYDAIQGDLVWNAPAGDHSYSSPQLVQLGKREAVLMQTNTGLHAYDPVSGDVLVNYDAPCDNYGVLQPLQVEGFGVLLGLGVSKGTREVEVSLKGDKFQAAEQWTSLDLKPNFSDWVAHEGFLYGFDQGIFACLDLKTGERQWKKGRYGSGQVLLLPDEDQLLVLTEKGDLVLLRATPEQHEELGQQKAITGKTWNHPVLVGDRLYVRNAEEAACFQVALRAKGSGESSAN